MLSLVTGRRSKLLVALICLLLAGGLASQAGKLSEVQENGTVSFLPDDAESVAALEAAKAFPSGEITPAVVVVRRDDGLTAADRALVAELRDAYEGAQARVADDDRAAEVFVPIRAPGGSDEVKETVEELRDRLEPARADGLQAAVTGAAGFGTDLGAAFEGLDTRLLAITGSLVLLLLVLIYRSPIFWTVPFFTVLIAEGASRGAGALLGEAGLTIDGQSSGILSVLVFGAATDYALLLVARYREELGREEDPHRAMATALRGAAPAILASGGTVVLGLLTLLAASVSSTQGIGPLGAAGVALAVALSLTLLPATLLIVGRRAFWPFIPRVDADGADHRRGWWARLGERISVRPRRVWIGATLVLVVLSLGLTGLDPTLSETDGFTDEPEAVVGQRLLAESFPAGESAPATVVVPDAEAAGRVRAALEASDLVAGVGRAEEGPPGVQLQVVLADDPFGSAAVDAIPRLREVVEEAAGPGALVGGQTAQAYDLQEAAQRDNLVVPPLTLLVVLLVLFALLRAVVAPVLLLLTVVASFAAALGAAVVIYDLLGFAAVYPTLPLLGFVFLVALGIDYNIFLMARAREESARVGTRRGVLVALAATGGVITSAGIVLAGTFSVLTVLPLVVLVELGVVVAFGVLLDTLLVRSVLVPALVRDVGPAVWWPSRLARRREDDRSG
jgi:RND superfamily putative drug exporter